MLIFHGFELAKRPWNQYFLQLCLKTRISWKSLFFLSKINVFHVPGYQKSHQNRVQKTFEKTVVQKSNFEWIWGRFHWRPPRGGVTAASQYLASLASSCGPVQKWLRYDSLPILYIHVQNLFFRFSQQIHSNVCSINSIAGNIVENNNPSPDNHALYV